MAATVTDLLLVPQSPCGCSQNYCPLLRTCTVCGEQFTTARHRRQHQNGCEGRLNIHIAQAQHVHRSTQHRRR